MKKINLTIISSLVAFAVLSASALAQDIFEPIINKLLSLGILNAMLLFLFAAIAYALLKKSKIFGESEILNGVVAFIIAFLIFIFPFITGVSLVNPISIFFTQSIVIIIFLMIGFIMASFFYPDMPKVLADQFTRRSTLYVMIGLAIGLFITSGLVTTLLAAFSGPKIPKSETGPPSDVLIIGAGLILFIIILLVATSVGRGGG
ncbi:MAG TPA: hypothetical protein VJJ76_02360 [archaeon]|nr:hypothetical protein [archaeon]